MTNLSFAQMDDMAVGLNGTLSVPIGDFNDIAKMGFGVSGTFYYDLSDNFQFTGTLGYLAWGGDKLNLAGIATQESKSSFTTIPVLAGFRYIFQGDNLLPYVSGELGLNVLPHLILMWLDLMILFLAAKERQTLILVLDLVVVHCMN